MRRAPLKFVFEYSDAPERRIESAKRELASGRLSVAAIARKLGFPSAQHFSTTFRRVEGLTPTAWRSRRGAR